MGYNPQESRRCFPLNKVVLRCVRLSSTAATAVGALTPLCATALTNADVTRVCEAFN